MPNWDQPAGRRGADGADRDAAGGDPVPLIPGLKALVARNTGDAAWLNIRPPHLKLTEAQARAVRGVRRQRAGWRRRPDRLSSRPSRRRTAPCCGGTSRDRWRPGRRAGRARRNTPSRPPPRRPRVPARRAMRGSVMFSTKTARMCSRRICAASRAMSRAEGSASVSIPCAAWNSIP